MVLSNYKENIDWVYRLPREIDVWIYQSRSPALHNVQNGSVHFKYVQNIGREPAKYLRAMLDFYDDPPDEILFMQAHEVSHHQCDTAGQIITTWAWGHTQDISWVDSAWSISANSVHNANWPVQLLRKGEDMPEVLKHYMPPKSRVVDHSIRSHDGCLNCCAQFASSGTALKSHPKSTYQQLLAWSVSMNKDYESSRAVRFAKMKGYVFEYLWGKLFQKQTIWKPWRRYRTNTLSVHNTSCEHAAEAFRNGSVGNNGRGDVRALEAGCKRAHGLLKEECGQRMIKEPDIKKDVTRSDQYDIKG